MMRAWVLDTSALMTLRDGEPGAQRVKQILTESIKGQSVCYGSFISLMEIYYRVWKDENEQAGLSAYRACLDMPIKWIHENNDLLMCAAALKATHAISLADAWIAATAIQKDATLVHKDPEFEKIRNLKHEQLPYK
jgi:predicted nucleic acid-binding protein